MTNSYLSKTKRHTKRHKDNKQKKKYTLKKHINNLSVKTLPVKFKLYGAKSYHGNAILEHARELENKYHSSCIMDNLTWLGTYNVAKNYKTKDLIIYEWEIKTPTRILIINRRNKKYLKNLFLKAQNSINPLIDLTKINTRKMINHAEKEGITNNYFTMSICEQSWYEFAFAYGYLSLNEQYQFLKLIKFLLDNNYISINMRNGDSIISKINRDIYYYNTVHLLPYKHKETFNRISFYQFDKSALTNLCKVLPNTIAGVFQPNENSFWFPNFIIYQMNIEEYVLFNPHRKLKYIKSVD